MHLKCSTTSVAPVLVVIMPSNLMGYFSVVIGEQNVQFFTLLNNLLSWNLSFIVLSTMESA